MRGFPGMKGDPGTFGENSCKFFGSDEMKGWQCPDSHPIYSGGSLGQNNMKMYCSGGVAKNATCNGASGTGAQAKVFVNKGQIVDIKIKNGGRNYKHPPHIKIIATKGYGAILKADVSNGSVIGITIVDGGQDYNNPPELQFETVDGGYGATASTIVDNGRVVASNIVHTGQNYIIPPDIEFRGGGGKGAGAIAEINEGHLISIRMTSGGAGYTTPPVVVITPGASKTGCSFCHMCCKKNPKETRDNQVQTQYENRMEQTEQDVQKILKQLHDQQAMLELAMKSGQTVKPEPRPAEKPKKAVKEERPEEDPVTLAQQMQQRRAGVKPKPEERTPEEKKVIKEQQDLSKMMLKAAERGKGVDIEELDKYRRRLAANPNLSGDDKLKRFMAEKDRVQPRQYQDWAKLGSATQSSTYKSYPASNAIDGNLDTFSHTNITVTGKSWFKVDLPTNVEIQKIVISNRLGSFDIRNRLAPFVVEVYNSLGAKVGSKRFTGTHNEYKWEPVELVGKTIKLSQEGKNYLHIGGISVWGEQALECSEYEKKFIKYRNMVDKILLDTKNASEMRNKGLYIKQRRLYEKLMNSCSKLDVTTKKEKDKAIKEQAAAYDKVLKKQKTLNEIKAKKAKKLWNKIEKRLEEEKKTAAEAKKLGLPPPPPLYSQSQIDTVKKNMKFNQANMSQEKKARCMYLLRDAMSKRSTAENYGRTAAFIPFLIPIAKKKGKRSEKAWDRYNAECD